MEEGRMCLRWWLFTVLMLRGLPPLLLLGYETFFDLSKLLDALWTPRRVNEMKVRALMEGLENLGGRHVSEVARGSHAIRIEVDYRCFAVGTVAKVPPGVGAKETVERSLDRRVLGVEEAVDKVVHEIDYDLTRLVPQEGLETVHRKAGPPRGVNEAKRERLAYLF